MGLVALVSAGLGFVVRGFVGRAQPPPAQIAETPSPVPAPAPPVAAPIAAPAPTGTTDSQVAATPVVLPAPPVATQPAPAQPAPAPSTGPQEPQAAALRQFSVPYKSFEGQAERIIIQVKLNGRETATMALDTGAPGTILFTPLAERLGVLAEGSNRLMTTVGGIGGRTPAALVVLDSLSVDEARTEFVPATVTKSMTDAFEGLVGMDFLAGYSVHIDTQQHRLVLTELPKSIDRPAGHDEAWWRRTFTQMESQQTLWRQLHATMKERISRSNVSGDGSAEALSFAERQVREAEQLASRLERYASNNAVPREWRRE